MKILNVWALTLILLLTACGDNNGSTNVGNPNGNVTTGQKIQMGQLVDGKSAVTIPLGIFGTKQSDIGNSTIDIQVNGALRHNDIKAASYFSVPKNAVAFTLSSLKSQDRVTFLITLNSGALKRFEGLVSSAEDTEALDLDAPEEEDGNANPDLDVSSSEGAVSLGVYQCVSNCREVIICSNQFDAVADFEENLASASDPFRVFQKGNHMHVNAPGDTSNEPDYWDEDFFNVDGNGVARVDLEFSEFGPERSEGHCDGDRCDILRMTFDFDANQFTFKSEFVGVVSGGRQVCPLATYRKSRN